MPRPMILLLFSLFECVAAIRWSNDDAPKIDFTVKAANGTSQHGSDRILCYPLTWPNLATFLLGNFAAHIATVQSTPGEKWKLTAFNMVLALLFPTSGLMRGMNAIVRNFSSSTFCRKVVSKILRVKKWMQEESSLDKACKAGALCIVVRNANWRPTEGDGGIPARLSTMNKEAIQESLGLELRLMRGYTVRDVASLAEGQDDGGEANTQENSGSGSPHELHPQGNIYTLYHIFSWSNILPETILKIYQPTWLKENQSAWWTFFDMSWGQNIVDPTLTSIHGSYSLPDGYSFAILPRNTVVRATLDPSEIGTAQCKIASSYSLLKILASIAQLLAASYTLWLHRGDQVNRWGFASFIFVPIPYAIMSSANGISHLFTPEYPSIYMVSSGTMEEAIDAGGVFIGVVGHVIPVKTSDDDTGYSSGFGSNWKGLAPGIVGRSFLSIHNKMHSRERKERDIVVCERALPAQVEHEEQPASPKSHAPIVKRSELSCLLVEQSLNSVEESYFIKPANAPKDVLESTISMSPIQQLSKRSVKFGAFAGIVFAFLIGFELLRNPKKTWKDFKAIMNKSKKIPIAASIRGIQTIKKMARRPTFWLLYKPIILSFSDKIRHDNLPHLSFRACERFQRQDDAQVLVSSTFTTSSAVQLPLRADVQHIPIHFQKRKECDVQIRGLIAQATIGIIISSLSILVIGLLSKFHAGSSSLTEQVILMMWLALGIVVGFLVPFFNIQDTITILVRVPLELLGGMAKAGLVDLYTSLLIMCYPWSIFVVPIWGFVIVGQQLNQWGTCATLY